MRTPLEQAKEDARVALWRLQQALEYNQVRTVFEQAEKYYTNKLVHIFEKDPTRLWSGEAAAKAIRAALEGE